MNTTPPSMPEDGRHISGSNPRRMARGKVGHPESPGSRRGLFVDGVTRFFCGRRYAVFLWTALRGFFVDGVMRFFCGRRYAVFLWTALCGFLWAALCGFLWTALRGFLWAALCPAWGFLCPQEAPGGNPGTPGMKTTPPSMPDDGRHISGSSPRRMARGKVRHPESPGSRRGLFVDGVMPGLGLLVSPRSPGWQPGDTGHENHPAIHAGRRHAHLRFEPAPHGTREGAPPGVPRLPPGAFCGRRYAVFCGRRYARPGASCVPKKPRVATRGHRA